MTFQLHLRTLLRIEGPRPTDLMRDTEILLAELGGVPPPQTDNPATDISNSERMPKLLRWRKGTPTAFPE